MKLALSGIRKLNDSDIALAIARYDVKGRLATEFKKFGISQNETKNQLLKRINKWFDSNNGKLIDEDIIYLTANEEKELRKIL